MIWWGYREAYIIIKKIWCFVVLFCSRQVSCLYLNNATLTTPAQLIMSTGRAALLMARQRMSRRTGKTLL
jgi:hypothetical protein